MYLTIKSSDFNINSVCVLCTLTDLCGHMDATVYPHVWKSSLITSRLSTFLFLFETRSLAVSGAH